jgi:hypothetical protein
MNINAIAGNYVISKGFALARFGNDTHFQELGDMDNFVLNIDVTRDERKDNRYGVARTSDSQVTEINVTFSATLMQHTNLNRSLGVMGSNLTLTQAAGGSTTVTIETAKANQLYWLQKLDLTVVTVTDGDEEDPETLVLGTDYQIDTRSGFIQPLADFPKIAVTFTAAEITAASKRLITGIGGNPDIEAEIIYIGNATKGQKPFLRLWKARITPTGGRGYIGTDRTGIEIEGTLQIDTAKALAMGNADEYAFGYETTLAA